MASVTTSHATPSRTYPVATQEDPSLVSAHVYVCHTAQKYWGTKKECIFDPIFVKFVIAR